MNEIIIQDSKRLWEIIEYAEEHPNEAMKKIAKILHNRREDCEVEIMGIKVKGFRLREMTPEEQKEYEELMEQSKEWTEKMMREIDYTHP